MDALVLRGREPLMPRSPDRFDRKFAAYRKEHGMTGTDPLSPQCEARMHRPCSGKVWDKLKDEPVLCTCSCHRHPATRRNR